MMGADLPPPHSNHWRASVGKGADVGVHQPGYRPTRGRTTHASRGHIDARLRGRWRAGHLSVVDFMNKAFGRHARHTARHAFAVGFAFARANALFGALCVFPLHHACAQESPPPVAAPLPDTVVTAARVPQQLSDLDSQVERISRQDILRQGYGDITDLLRNDAAVDVIRNGGEGNSTSVYLRGAQSQHTMVLVDGVRVDTQAASGGVAWETIPLSQIDHIEIVQGPASAMYGSDAIGGVIQIFTLKGQGAPKLDLGVAAGSLHTVKDDASISGSSAIDYAFSAASGHSAGFALVTDPNNADYSPLRAGYDKHDFSARLGAQVDAQDRFELLALSSHLNSHYDAYASPTLLGDSAEDTTLQKLGWGRDWSEALHTQLSLGQSQTAITANGGGDLNHAATRIRTYSWEGSWLAGEGARLLFALDRQDDTLHYADVYDGALTAVAGERHDNGAALGYILQQGRLDVQTHVRHDLDSQFGSADTASLGLGWRLDPAFKLVAQAGNAFHAPTLFQNASMYGPLSLPSGQSLRPERSHSVEAGLHYDSDSAGASVTAFRNRIEDLINFEDGQTRCANPYNSCYVNVQSAQIQGLSAEGHVHAMGAFWRASLTRQSPRNLVDGTPLLEHARAFGSLSVHAPVQNWDLGATWLVSASRADAYFNSLTYAQTPVRDGGYTLLNLEASLKLDRDWRLQVNLDNAFNRHYQTVYGYAQAPCTILIGLRYSPTL